MSRSTGCVLAVELPLVDEDGRLVYPDLSGVSRHAARMQRAAADLSGVAARGARDMSAVAESWRCGRQAAFPAAQDAGKPAPAAPDKLPDDYPFVRVDGDGVHEIAVGPVHAGIIEPGHFRFSVVGEKVLRLEQRLGYTHKGIEQRFTATAGRCEALSPGRAGVGRQHRGLCLGLLHGAGVGDAAATVPARARWLRALMLERERIANHLGDLGALGNDAALAFGWRSSRACAKTGCALRKRPFGHRLMMDCIVPGGVAVDLDAARSSTLLRASAMRSRREVRTLRAVFDEHMPACRTASSAPAG